jgi:hypothetical protein
MNIIEKLNKINLDITGKKDDLYEQCKLMSGLIKGSLSKMNKNELKIILDNLKKYKENIDPEYKKFKFGDEEITLDEEQLQYVTYDGNNNIRVLAGAGSGKTSSTLCRCKYLIEKFTLPNRILLLTFNVDACQNMVKKANKLFGFEINIEIRTIDSFCSSIIWKYKEMDSKNENTNNFFNEKDISMSEICIEGHKLMLKYGNIISQNYDYVMIDECQDINETQFNIFKIFEKNGCNLTMIGDDNQSIYQWRGSNIYYIINMEKIIANVKTFKITYNYRSCKHIVKSANKSIENNKIRVDKKMKHTRENDKKIKLVIKNTAYEQCDYILNLIGRKITEGKKYNDIAILSRNGTMLKIIETYFEKKKIPYIASITDKNTAYDEKLTIIRENHVTVSTIHKSKGLEWDTVIIVGLNDNFWPSHMNNNIKNIEEERRLFYVAITRPKNDLIFMGSSSDIPVSRFIKELDKKYIEYELETSKDIFGTNDKNIPKLKYSVTELIVLLQGKDINELRELNLALTNGREERLLFDEMLDVNDDIKENFFESDFGEFNDKLITREIMLTNGEIIRDIDTELLINGINLTEKEMEVYQKYELEKIILSKNYRKNEIIEIVNNINELKNNLNDKKIALSICEYIKENIEFRRVNTYPDIFIDQLTSSYKKYVNKDFKNKDIMKDVYYISLSRKILNERRRLIYRDIYALYMKDFDKINNRIIEYAELYEEKETTCKMNMRKIYKIAGENVIFSGELDMYNKSDKMIVDFKCSCSDYKIEWTLQVLIYCALLIEGGKLKKEDVEYVCIFNILKGKEYLIEIPKDYNYTLLLLYVEQYLEKELKYENYKTDLENDKYKLSTLIKSRGKIINKEEPKRELIDFSKIEQKSCTNGNYMSVDVETGTKGVTSDIIQLSYIIYDKNNKEIKSSNKYIKDRIVDNFLFNIHGISSDYLKENGEDFDKVMINFVNDMNNCEIVLGHNVISDIKHIRSNIEKFKINIKYDVFDKKEIMDTMKLGKTMFNLNKNPSLTELTRITLKVDMTNEAHNAYNDCKFTAQCYQKMFE